MKGILFLPQFFPAIDEGRKTMTRRLMKPQPDCTETDTDGVLSAYTQPGLKLLKPRYQPGEVCFIKEGWACSVCYDSYSKVSWHVGEVAYRSGGGFDFEGATEQGKWRNAMFMPEWAARRFIRITAVRAERLQDISEADAKAEGIERHFDMKYLKGRHGPWQAGFATLWDEINGRGSWDTSPFVWVYSFVKVARP